MLPENIRLLCSALPVTDNLFQLNTRMGRVDEKAPYKPLCDENSSQKGKARCQKIRDDWNEFHSHLPYQSFDQFFSKERLCQDISALNIDLDTFILLICDRAFLFLDYAEHLSAAEYPSLIDTYTKPQAIQSNFLPDKIEAIHQHGFMPTNALNDEWERWKNSVANLQHSLAARENHISREARNFDDIQLDMPSKDTAISELDQRLSHLFSAYLSALANSAYRPEFQDLVDSAECNAIPWIHAVCDYAQNEKSDLPCAALLVWVLFVKFTNKLAKGSLRKYKFRMEPSKEQKKRADLLPEQLNGNLSQKKRVDIILFDHLLDLLPSKDREYSKYQFYVLTRFDRFTHYHTTIEKYQDFNCTPNLSDGVDQLGCLVRYHITHCLMNTPAWLTMAVPHMYSKPLLNSLTALLLYDATLLPSRRRITDRVRLFMNSAEGDQAITDYRKCAHDSEQITKLLDRLCEENNLNFEHAHVFSGEESLNDPNVKQCERFVLEYALKDKTFEEYYVNLFEKAKQLFPADYFLSENVFRM